MLPRETTFTSTTHSYWYRCSKRCFRNCTRNLNSCQLPLNGFSLPWIYLFLTLFSFSLALILIAFFVFSCFLFLMNFALLVRCTFDSFGACIILKCEQRKEKQWMIHSFATIYLFRSFVKKGKDRDDRLGGLISCMIAITLSFKKWGECLLISHWHKGKPFTGIWTTNSWRKLIKNNFNFSLSIFLPCCSFRLECNGSGRNHTKRNRKN